jgi:heme exporter protein A
MATHGIPVAAAVEARALTLVRGRQVILRDVNLAIASGEILVLVGCNGSGKTTLLQCLAGALRPSAGAVVWFGEPAAKSASARRLVGFLGHESGLYPALTVWENLVFAGRMYGLEQVYDRAAALLSAAGLQQFRRHRVGSLSRGMRQRLAIARAIIHDPPLLLLDEPFTSLDSDSRGWLADFLSQLRNRSRAILIASHEDEQSRDLADRLIQMQRGCVYTIGRGPGTSIHPDFRLQVC